jgi:hypothetical protein
VRCYWGAPDSQLQALLDRQAALLAELRKLEPEAHCTYHPDGELYQAHVWGRPLSKMHRSREAALMEAIDGYRTTTS